MNGIHWIRSSVISKWLAAFIVFSLTVLYGCGSAENRQISALKYRYASKEEG
jgi:hypothetical protein